MKPLKLKLQAFGPYLTEQVLDFEALSGQGLFLIHGPTGAGKTSIFDAITYAFYGCGSGDDRNKPDGLRSDHAPPELRTEVSLDFALGEQRYRVIRKAEFERPKARGEGFKIEPASAELMRLEGSAGSYQEVEKIAAGWEKVNRAVEGLLKLGVRQFCQVIILPQGQFRRFLSGTSAEREKILEILFRTTRYKKIQDNLDARAADITKAFKELEGQLRGLLQSHEGAENPEVILAAKVAAEALAETLRAQAAAEESLRAEAQSSLNAAEQSQNAFRNHAAARAAHAELNAKADEMATLSKELESAERAEPARFPDQQLNDAVAAGEKITAATGPAKAKLASTAEELRRADELLRASRSREEEKALLEHRLEKLTEIGKELSGLEELRSQMLSAESALQKEEAASVQLQKSYLELEASLPALRNLEGSLRQQADSAGASRQVLNHQRGLEKDARAWQEGHAQRKVKLEAGANIDASVLAAEAALAAAESFQIQAQDEWVKGQAAILAASLAHGDPCPVCGAHEHPALAAVGAKPPPKDSLILAKARVDSARGFLEKARKNQATFQNETLSMEALLADLEGRLKHAGFTTAAALSQELNALENAVKAAEAAMARLGQTSQELKNSEMRLGSLRAKVAEQEKALSEAKIAAVKARTRVEETNARLRAHEMKTVGEARAAYAATKATIEEIKKALAAASAAREQALQKDLSARESLRSLEAQAVENNELQKSFRENFAAALSAQGFASEEAFRAALRPRPSLKEMQLRLKAFDHARLETTTRLAIAEREIAGKQISDPAPLRIRLSEIQTNLADLSRRQGDAERQVAQTTRLLNDIAQLTDKRSKLHEEFSVFGRMAEVAKGGNEKGMSFQRYVLATFLDEVVETASLRFRQSSKGRYSLKRATSHEDLRKTGGLELVVEDGWHGTVRPVSTLSGGEGFQASLAMALGLAEVVQAEAGGVYLDAVFIDEGFGTLDSEALDLAMRTLMDLQKGGRLVGIISHVPELKQIIPSRVEIQADRQGSRIAMA